MRSVWRIPLLCTSVLNMHNFSPFPMAASVSRVPNLTFLDFSKIKNRLNFLMWFSKIVHQRGHWGKIWANPKYLSWPKIFDIFCQPLLDNCSLAMHSHGGAEQIEDKTNMENIPCYARSFWHFSTSLHALLPY